MAKADFVRVMFNDISSKYDLLNDILSAGTHRIWKKQFVKFALKQNPRTALDCATGTGDIAFKLKEFCTDNVIGIDFSEEMIKNAKIRAKLNPLAVEFKVADIQKLPFLDKSFDISTISFGIRNVENLEIGLKELGRVSRGVYILEFGQPKNTFLKKLYFAMLRLYVPIFGLITKRKDAYEYLIASSEAFPSADTFVEIMKKATSFKNYGFIPVFGGIAYIYFANDSEV